MNRLRPWTIRWKIVGIVVLTTAIALAAGFSVLLARTASSAKEDLVESNIAVARVTGQQAVIDIAFEDRQEAQKTLSKLGAIPTVVAAAIYDEKGQRFAGWARNGDSQAPETDLPPSGEYRFAGDRLVVSEPIIYEGDAYGTIILTVSTEPVAEKIQGTLMTLVGVMLVLLAGATLLALPLERVVSRPILALAAAAREISESHDYSVRVTKEGEDEIGLLSDGFNDMLEQIERRERERDEADQRTREKSQFLANMSHELRTPLNAIIGFSEILRSRSSLPPDSKEGRFLDHIHTSGQHLLGIVNDILDLSKIEAGRMDIHTERFALDGAIEGVCNLMRGIAARRRVSIDVVSEGDVPAIEADVVKIKQILYNLLSNAVKFSPEGATVTIRTSTRGAEESPLGARSVVIDVIDRGIGIDPSNHDLIFREFQQVDGTISRAFEGTGLGLALVRKLVELHGGTIELESALGEGSTFTITLPVRSALEPPVREVEPVGEVTGGATILVIEDEDSSFEAIRTALSGTEFDAVRASTGDEGIRFARTMKPAAILLDLVLPDLGGFEVLRQLKTDPELRTIPVIVVTLLDTNRELGFALGVDDYLTKPVDTVRLVDSLRNHLTTASFTGRHVLVIDDDPQFHEIVEECLANEDVRLSHAFDGAQGIRMAESDPPSLVILDVVMQEMDGFEVAVRLQQNPATSLVPVLVVSARDLSGADHHRLRGRISALVEKPRLTQVKLVSLVRLLTSSPAQVDSNVANEGRTP